MGCDRYSSCACTMDACSPEHIKSLIVAVLLFPSPFLDRWNVDRWAIYHIGKLFFIPSFLLGKECRPGAHWANAYILIKRCKEIYWGTLLKIPNTTLKPISPSQCLSDPGLPFLIAGLTSSSVNGDSTGMSLLPHLPLADSDAKPRKHKQPSGQQARLAFFQVPTTSSEGFPGRSFMLNKHPNPIQDPRQHLSLLKAFPAPSNVLTWPLKNISPKGSYFLVSKLVFLLKKLN